MANLLRAIETVGKNEIETSVIKATFNDDDKPKEKHVLNLIRASNLMPSNDFINYFGPRLIDPCWKVALKALVVLHRLMREAHEDFMKLLLRHRSMFNLNSYLDRSSTTAWGESRVVRSYGDYLAEKLYVFQTLGYCGERQQAKEARDTIMNMKRSDICKSLPLLAIQFDKLLQIKPYLEDGMMLHSISANAFALLVRDAFRLYAIFNVMFFRVLEDCVKLTPEEAEVALKAYKDVLAQNDVFHEWSVNLAKLGLIKMNLLPDFDDLPKISEAFTSVLEKHIASASSTGPSSVSGSGTVSRLVPNTIPTRRPSSSSASSSSGARPTLPPRKPSINRTAEVAASEDEEYSSPEYKQPTRPLPNPSPQPRMNSGMRTSSSVRPLPTPQRLDPNQQQEDDDPDQSDQYTEHEPEIVESEADEEPTNYDERPPDEQQYDQDGLNQSVEQGQYDEPQPDEEYEAPTIRRPTRGIARGQAYPSAPHRGGGQPRRGGLTSVDSGSAGPLRGGAARTRTRPGGPGGPAGASGPRSGRPRPQQQQQQYQDDLTRVLEQSLTADEFDPLSNPHAQLQRSNLNTRPFNGGNNIHNSSSAVNNSYPFQTSNPEYNSNFQQPSSSHNLYSNPNYPYTPPYNNSIRAPSVRNPSDLVDALVPRRPTTSSSNAGSNTPNDFFSNIPTTGPAPMDRSASVSGGYGAPAAASRSKTAVVSAHGIASPSPFDTIDPFSGLSAGGSGRGRSGPRSGPKINSTNQSLAPFDNL